MDGSLTDIFSLKCFYRLVSQGVLTCISAMGEFNFENLLQQKLIGWCSTLTTWSIRCNSTIYFSVFPYCFCAWSSIICSWLTEASTFLSLLHSGWIYDVEICIKCFFGEWIKRRTGGVLISNLRLITLYILCLGTCICCHILFASCHIKEVTQTKGVFG